jgi:DNA-binding NtrC family response regulator
MEEATQAVFPQNPPLSTTVYNKFDKLSHIRILLLINAYSRLESASAATRIQALELEAKSLPPQQRTRFHGLVGNSQAMREIYRRIEAAAYNKDPVLILGEAGSGKELIARAIHECAAWQGGPFAVLRCAALPGYLIENELLGYRPQQMSGMQSYLGLYAAAEGGTLLLDEITLLPPNVQDKLAQLLDGQTNGWRNRVKIVASTRCDFQEASRVGQLREGFCKLFGESTICVPPLRERRKDIALLARHFIDLHNRKMAINTAVAGIDDAAREMMERYLWPGNVHELCQAIESAMGCARSALIGLADLPTAISGLNGPARELPSITFETFADAERGVLQRALELTGGNKLRAAKLLKISRKKLYTGIAKYGLKPEEGDQREPILPECGRGDRILLRPRLLAILRTEFRKIRGGHPERRWAEIGWCG